MNARRFATAWSCLRTATRQAFGGYAEWRRGYRTTAYVHIVSAVTTDQAAGLAHVRFTIRSCRHAGGGGVVERASGTWFAQNGYAGWRIGAPHAQVTMTRSVVAC